MSSRTKINTLKRNLVDEFGPFWFVTVMGTGISSCILHSFPYSARWLRICSYIMFAIACLLFISLLSALALNLAFRIHKRTLRDFAREYFFDNTHNVFWGTLPMGFITIINYIFQLAEREFKGKPVANHLVILVYVLWWVNAALSLSSAWGISFCLWLKHSRYWANEDADPVKKAMRQQLQSVLLLPVVPLVVLSSSSGIFTMSDLFLANTNRNVQLLTLGVTALIWFNALLLTVLILSTYTWNLYVNKIPPVRMIFTMFLVVGPMGQGSYGILLFTDNIKKYIEQYYPSVLADGEIHLISVAVQWSFKVCGIILGLLLISNGIFFTLLSFAAIISYANTLKTSNAGFRISDFHKGWWAITFPMGTMALGTNELFQQYNPYVQISAFRVVSAIYAVLCIGSTIICILGCIWLYHRPVLAFLSPQRGSQHGIPESDGSDSYVNSSQKVYIPQV
ncbi:LANO_0E08218g1_1 [Lachancea nothofagi CBS 11611]|uniref:LANO_0E08218g1_1 n=1 Tax=Lachancea nothofagi CBS 11611 TaxID=1266666 RepID=A0A1G4JUZ0_9SACH|nr:LANO_0E08218g1_1 [Lachancea nothofagi CBS 11611]